MYESCSPRKIDEIIAEVCDPALNPHGFLRSTPRKYVRKRIEYSHDVIELLSQKISLRMIWGVSFDFVPHIAGRATETVQWHRTARSANPDLRYSEGENASQPTRRFDISTIQGDDLIRKQARSALAEMVPRALKCFDSIPDLLRSRGCLCMRNSTRSGAICTTHLRSRSRMRFIWPRSAKKGMRGLIWPSG
jgi:hypothetical protein